MASKNHFSANLFQLFDGKNSNSAGSKQLRNLYKILNNQLATRLFHKQSKSHVLALEAPNKLIFPKDEKQELNIELEYLIIQCFIESGNHFNLELDLKDGNKTRRRIVFTNSVSKVEKKPFFVKIPSNGFQRQIWINMCIDLKSFMNFFQKYPVFNSLQGLTIGGSVKIRKIYFSKSPLEQGDGFDQSVDHLQQNLPKTYCFPAGTKYTTQIIDYQKFQDEEFKTPQNVSLPKINPASRERSTPKAGQTINKRNLSNEQKRFMSNTNSTEIVSRLGNEKKDRYQSKNKTAIKNKKQIPPLPRRTDVNSWKQGKKPINELSTQSEKVSQLKKNYVKNKFDQVKKGQCSNYSDSDYLEMSQKFSTVTNPKLFKNFRPKEQQPEIEQFIEVEDSTPDLKQTTKTQHMKTVQEPQNQSELNQSQEGFLQQHLKNYVGEAERPYTPPLYPEEVKEVEKAPQKVITQQKQIQLIYDPILNCYYDFKTNTYYQLKQ